MADTDPSSDESSISDASVPLLSAEFLAKHFPDNANAVAVADADAVTNANTDDDLVVQGDDNDDDDYDEHRYFCETLSIDDCFNRFLNRATLMQCLKTRGQPWPSFIVCTTATTI